MDSSNVYCRREARARLEKEGMDQTEAFLITTDIKNIVEGVVDGKEISKGYCKTCGKVGSHQS